MKVTPKSSAPPSQAPGNSPPPGAVRPRRPRRVESRGRKRTPAVYKKRYCLLFNQDITAIAQDAERAGQSVPVFIAHHMRLGREQTVRRVLGLPQMEEAT